MEKSEEPSAQDIAAVRVATILCDSKILKKEILCAPGSNYAEKEYLNYAHRNNIWWNIISGITIRILKEQRLPLRLIKKVTGIVLLVAWRILTWASYHEGQIGFSRAYSMSFLNSSFFPEGIIDNKRAAQSLINNRNLSAKQKFKLACLYCFTDDIRTAVAEMTEEDMEEFYNSEHPENITQPHLVEFWTNYLMKKVRKTGKTLDRHRIKNAVKSGSKAAVEYFLTLANFNTDLLIDAALAAAENIQTGGEGRIIFRYDYDICGFELWVPKHYFVDILHFVLSKMNKDIKIEFFKRDISEIEYGDIYTVTVDWTFSVLKCFLNWPFHYEFMKYVELMWDSLPKESFCDLLLCIFNKVISGEYEDKIYDYRNLFQEFWHRCPERFKRFTYSNKKIKSGVIKCDVKPISYILEKFITFENLAIEDGKLLESLFSSVTEEEVENIICCSRWADISLKLMGKEKWDILDWFFTKCSPSDMQPNNLKKKFICSQYSHIFIRLLSHTNLYSFHRWSRLSVEEINLLLSATFDSEIFKSYCIRLATDQLDTADMILKRFIASEEYLILYKIELISSANALTRLSNLVIQGKSESVEKVLNWCFTREEDIQEFKKKIAYATEKEVFVNLILNHRERNVCKAFGFIQNDDHKFFEGIWEEMEIFLTWCFSTEKDIKDFKKTIFGSLVAKIHLDFVMYNKWQEAEIFFSWLELSKEQIRELKRRTLLNYEPFLKMFRTFMYSHYHERFPDYGGKDNAIELILRWFLTDEQLLSDFKNKFYRPEYHMGYSERRKEGVLCYFDSMLEQRLKDIHEEQKDNT